MPDIPPLRLREIWTARELVYFFALRDLRARYKQAVLGVAWVLLVPLIGAASFTLLFNGLAEIETDGSYFVFALSGFVIWTFASTLIAAVAGTLLDHEDLITITIVIVELIHHQGNPPRGRLDPNDVGHRSWFSGTLVAV